MCFLISYFLTPHSCLAGAIDHHQQGQVSQRSRKYPQLLLGMKYEAAGQKQAKIREAGQGGREGRTEGRLEGGRDVIGYWSGVTIHGLMLRGARRPPSTSAKAANKDPSASSVRPHLNSPSFRP